LASAIWRDEENVMPFFDRDLVRPDGRVAARIMSRRCFLGASLVSMALLALGCAVTPADKVDVSGGTTGAAAAIAAPAGTPNAAPTVAPTSESSSALPTVGPTATAAGQVQVLALTDSSADVEDLTPALTEGPYFKANSPERALLVGATTAGTKLTITGRVLSTRGLPIAKALLDFWQADTNGSYDNAGYTLRGHQFTTAEGRYQLQTVIPGLYPGRTRHIHVKVQAPNGPVLTTQLFFPNEAQNSRDSIFNPKLVLPIKEAADGGKVATFDFVVSTS
jgi:protocatechuate 3,4-dioxygenase beta subunit